MLDDNANMENDRLARMLRHPDLEIQDVVKLRSNIEGLDFFVRGSRQIDGAWVTTDIYINTACFLPFYFRLGDHR